MNGFVGFTINSQWNCGARVRFHRLCIAEMRTLLSVTLKELALRPETANQSPKPPCSLLLIFSTLCQIDGPYRLFWIQYRWTKWFGIVRHGPGTTPIIVLSIPLVKLSRYLDNHRASIDLDNKGKRNKTYNSTLYTWRADVHSTWGRCIKYKIAGWFKVSFGHCKGPNFKFILQGRAEIGKPYLITSRCIHEFWQAY